MGSTAIAMHKGATLLSKGPKWLECTFFFKGPANLTVFEWFIFKFGWSKLALEDKAVTGGVFWTTCDNAGPPNWGVCSAADTALHTNVLNRPWCVSKNLAQALQNGDEGYLQNDCFRPGSNWGFTVDFAGSDTQTSSIDSDVCFRPGSNWGTFAC